VNRLLRSANDAVWKPSTPCGAEPCSNGLDLLAVGLTRFESSVTEDLAFGRNGWSAWWGNLPVMDRAQEVLDHLTGEGFLESDGDLLFIGPAAERRFGRRHFMDLTAASLSIPSSRCSMGGPSSAACHRRR
jgi:hypothetical protein